MSLTTPQTSTKETITASMSRWAASLEYRQLSQDAVYQAKRFLLDSVGCALGGYQQHDVIIALEVLKEIAGRGPATVIGTGHRMDTVSASLANALMIRCMDYNDIYWKQDPSHPSDIFPAAMACCERAKSDGKELIVGFVLGHEFEMRLCEAAFPGIRERGWHHATLTAFVSPIVAGRALHLTWEKIQHAIGISASRHCTMGAVTAGKLTMMKNTVDPMATQSGVLAALLAERGYTGPEHVIDGQEGLVHCYGPEWTPAEFEVNKIMDQTIRAQLKKVEVVADPEIEKVFPALQRVIVNITTIDGRKLSKQLDYPKGDPRNPLSDAEIEEKFRALAEGVLSAKAQDKLIDAIWNLEQCRSVAKLMALMKADVNKKPKAKAIQKAIKKVREPRNT